MIRSPHLILGVLPAFWWLAGCGGAPAAVDRQKPQPPARVSNGGIKEADLATITLTRQAEERLGIETAEVEFRAVERTLTLAGEVVVPPGHTLTASAPIAGTAQASPGGLPAVGTRLKAGQPVFRLLPLLPAQRDLRVTVEAEVASAVARLDAAKPKAERADRMLRDQVGSVRAQEDARQELTLAQTALQAARAKLEQINRAPLEADVTVLIPAPRDGILRQVYAAPGQTVASGAPLFEVADLDVVWIRVPVYTGELPQVLPGAPARVRALNGGPASLAQPAQAPPSADPLATTSDLFFQYDNRQMTLRPGEKVSVTLPQRGQERRLQVPWAAILHDIHGGAWVYENTAPQVFVRRRVEVDRVVDSTAILARGPKPGVKVVTAGAAELYGTEFGAGK